MKQFGTVAIVGRPNVGKSTLLNRILGTKLSITSRKPQTTRHAILGIQTSGDVQVAYVDTPGLQFQQKSKMHQRMNRSVYSMLADVDAVVMVVDGLAWNAGDEKVMEALAKVTSPVILVINKVDKLDDKSRLLPHIEQLAVRFPFKAIVPLSALQRDEVSRLEKILATCMPEGEHGFEADDLTDRSERFLVAEIIREKIIRQLGEEVPYDAAVEIERYEEKERLVEIHALILVAKPGQKKIVIGQSGARIKKIGIEAREDVEALLGKKVLLKLWVKVKAGWFDSDRALKSLGFE